MPVILNRAYSGYPSGAVVELSADTETALIAQGLASTALVTAITPGATMANAMAGTAAIPAAAISVTITNSMVDANSKVIAYVAQATADVSLLRVERIVCAAGSFTIFGTAAATATTLIDWAVLVPAGGLTIRN